MLAFIHINKTAGTTLKNILRSSFGIQHFDVEPWRRWERQRLDQPFLPEDLYRLKRFHPAVHSIAGHRVFPFVGLEQVIPEIRYYTILREPVNRTISFYQNTVRNQQARGESVVDFATWIQKEIHRDRQTYHLCGQRDHRAAIEMIEQMRIFVGLTEHFDETLVLMRRLFEPRLKIHYSEAKNVSISKELAQRLRDDPTALRMMEEANREDMLLYRHVVENIYPCYKRAYGASLAADTEAFRQRYQGFNQTNVVLNRVYRNLIYRPTIWFYRMFERSSGS